ncbi:MAG: hypothetical protein M3N91_13615 [Pseudomonadota bacterium]|nr:hypothetical protein [Pseudomonadota bacterium]
MTFRKLLLAAASIAAMAPTLSHASTEDTALKACAQAFATSLASASGAPTFKLKYHSESVGTLDNYYRDHEYTFYLQAHDPKTGSTLARATCSADKSGTVVALTATPAEASPTLAARF